MTVGEAGRQHVHDYEIFVDDKKFKVEQTSMTGADIKALAGVDPSYQLFLEREGHEDEQIQDNQSVPIKSGLHFYSVPPATFGR